MGLTEQARALAQFALTSNTGFKIDVTLSNPNLPDEAPLVFPAVCTKHNLNVTTDQYGNNNATNAETARILLDTKALTATGYTWMNASNHAAMLGHNVSFADATGTVFNFKVLEQWPNAFLGIITLMLQAYKPSA